MVLGWVKFTPTQFMKVGQNSTDVDRYAESTRDIAAATEAGKQQAAAPYGTTRVPTESGQEILLSPAEWEAYQRTNQLPSRFGGGQPARIEMDRAPTSREAAWIAANGGPSASSGAAPGAYGITGNSSPKIGLTQSPAEAERIRAGIQTQASADQAVNTGAIDRVSKDFPEIRQMATVGIPTIHSARAALDSGKVISGAGADFRLNFARAMSLSGSGDAKGAVEATQTFAATQARQVLTVIKNLGSGSGISDADRDYAAKIVGGDIKLDEGSMRRLLDISERALRAQASAHNAQVETTAEAVRNPSLTKLYSVPMPGEYASPGQSSPQLTPRAANNTTARTVLQQALKNNDQAAIAELRRKGYVQ